MFKNVWVGLKNWYKHDRYKTDEDKYAEELINQIVIAEDIEPAEKDSVEEGVIIDIQTTLKEAWIEWKEDENKLYCYNSWLEDKTGATDLIQKMYNDIIQQCKNDESENPEDIIRSMIQRLKTLGSTLYDTMTYRKELTENRDNLMKKLKKLKLEKNELLYKIRLLKERAMNDLRQTATQEEIDNINKCKEMFYGIFATDETFKEKIFDWIRDKMDDDSSRLVDCESDLARRCQDIADNTAEDHCNGSSSDEMWDIAREAIGDTDWKDIAYDNDIPDRDDVIEIINEELNENLEEHLDDKLDITKTVKKSLKEIIQTINKTLNNETKEEK